MSERKKQIWLRADQVDLVVTCLQFVKQKLNEGSLNTAAHSMAGRYTYRRIDDLLALFEPPKKQP